MVIKEVLINLTALTLESRIVIHLDLVIMMISIQTSRLKLRPWREEDRP